MTTLHKLGQISVIVGVLLLLLPTISFSSKIDDLNKEISQLRKRISILRISSQTEHKKILARQKSLEKNIKNLEISLNKQEKMIVYLVNYLGNIKSGIHEQYSNLAAKSSKSKEATKENDQSSSNNDLNQVRPNQYYQRGFDLLVKGAYTQADLTFSNFILTFPGHIKIPNATYWSGEARYLQKKFELALIRYEDIIESYPNSNKYSDSLLKASYSLIALKRYNEARQKLQQIVRQFSSKTVAKLARKKLELIDSLQ